MATAIPNSGAQSDTPLPHGLRLLDRVCGGVNRVAEIMVGLLVAAMTLDAFVQVVFRYAIESSLSWSEELARYLFVWVIFMGASVAVRRRQHIAMTALVNALPRRLRMLPVLLSLGAFLGFMALFFVVCLPLIDNAWMTLSPELEIPIAWVYLAAPVGAALSVLHLTNSLLQTLWHGPE